MKTILHAWLLNSMLLVSTLARAQTSYNRWDAHPAAPMITPLRSTTIPKATSAASISATRDSTSASAPGVSIQQLPEFPGGYSAFITYTHKNLKHPKGSKRTGTVWVTFTVLTTGAVTKVHVLPSEGLDAAYDAVTVEFISKLPSFSPGKMNGKPVDTEMRYPVEF